MSRPLMAGGTPFTHDPAFAKNAGSKRRSRLGHVIRLSVGDADQSLGIRLDAQRVIDVKFIRPIYAATR